ncbi:MAG: putative peptidase C39 family [Gammaproteobacteria bacterium]|nr:MAG: putative peptidase C39 family [Gammaproteobacteria bacterium]TND01958.1 MAG: putative peptidase, C39 family [Gammaproteobacteria bacterium]
MRGDRHTRPAPDIILLALLLVTLAGCATPQTDRLLESRSALPRQVELTAVPFFPQETHQCGPAALATVLDYSGLNVTPEDLAPQVYLPGRHGSLQFELLAAARRHGRVPYPLRPQLHALTTEVAAGNPVLVLQNLGIAAAPVWHYAVVVGFDLARAEVILRSGRERRHIMSLRTFEHTWRRSDYWAVVVLPTDQIPQTAEELPYLQSVLALERLARWQDAATAYGAALQRWPNSLGAHMGLGNSRYALGDLHGAEEVFRAAIRGHPRAAVAFNNLAQVLADQERWDDAQVPARRAVELGGENAVIFQQTLTHIDARTKQ